MVPCVASSSTDCMISTTTLQWRHNERDSVSNHQPHYCLLNHLFRRRSKKTSKVRVTGLCAGNSPGTSSCKNLVVLFDTCLIIMFIIVSKRWQQMNTFWNTNQATTFEHINTCEHITKFCFEFRNSRPVSISPFPSIGIRTINNQTFSTSESVQMCRSKCVINSLRSSDAYMRRQTNHHWFR